MKTILILINCVIAFSCYSQDTIKAKPTIMEYKYYLGDLYGIDSVGNYIKLDNHKYKFKNEKPPQIIGYIPPANRDTTVKAIVTNTNYHLERAGNLLIGASVTLIASGLLTGIGIAADVPELAYVGSGVGGVSIFLFLGSGINLRKAGRTELKRL